MDEAYLFYDWKEFRDFIVNGLGEFPLRDLSQPESVPAGMDPIEVANAQAWVDALEAAIGEFEELVFYPDGRMHISMTCPRSWTPELE